MTVVATAGHVDHGKSTLVRALTGTDPDRLEEERRRGLTIDLGFAHMTDPVVSIVDVPGHVRFLHTMIAGVGAVAGCLFVVDATEGWKEQSEDHLRVLELVGVRHGIVVLTKVDLLDDAGVAAAAVDVSAHVGGTFLERAPVVAVSAATGAGMERLVEELAALVERAGPALDRGRPRLWVDRAFTVRGAGTVVTGTLADGPVEVDQQLVVEPGDAAVRVRSIESAGRGVERIGPGHRVALNLVGIDHRAVARGMAVVEPRRWQLTDVVDATLQVDARLTHAVSRRGAYTAHLGSGEFPATLRLIGVDHVGPGDAACVRLYLSRRAPLLPGDRYVLRESGRSETVGGGEVLDVAPLRPVSRATPDRSVERVVRERGWSSVAEIERLTGVAVPATVGEWVTTPQLVAEVTATVRAAVDARGPEGVDVATFDERARAVLGTLDDIVVTGGVARPAGSVGDAATTLVLESLRAGGFSPPAPESVPRHEIRLLVNRGLVVERDGIAFHVDAIVSAGELAARLLETSEGFTVSEFRAAAGTTRKYALPMLAELDARGVTRRRGDVRIAGPRLPRRDDA